MSLLIHLLQVGLAPAAVTIGSGLALWAIRRILVTRIADIAKSTENKVDDLLVEVLQHTRSFALVGTALYLGSRWVPLSSPAERIGQRLFIVLLLLQGALWATTALAFLFRQSDEKRTDGDPAGRASMRAMAFAARVAVWSVFLLLCLDNLGVNITGLVAGLGVGGIAVALAIQNILGDLFASLSIVLDKPFQIGDFIIVDDVVGTVEHIGLKTTRVQSISGEQVIVSNGDLLKSRIRNFKRMKERRVIFSLGVTYQTSHQQLNGITAMIRRIVEQQPATRFERAHFKSFGDSSLVFEVVYFLTDPDYVLYMDVQQAINLEILKTFKQERIEFAYPTRTVFIAREPVL